MPSFVELLLAYGICFGLMNKVDFLHGKHAFLDAMLKCSYCTGFHAGWIAWCLTFFSREFTTLGMPVAWAFASAVFCYGADTVLQLAESWVRKED